MLDRLGRSKRFKGMGWVGEGLFVVFRSVRVS